MNYPPSNRRTAGFTLVELLVVITIIIVLAAVSFTGFRAMRKSANASTSASNMRQLGVALQTYVAEKGRFPSKLGDEKGVGWDRILMPYMGDPDFDYKAGGSDPIRVKTAEAAAAKSAINILYCPGDKEKAPTGQFRRSYALCFWVSSNGGPGFANGFAAYDKAPGTGVPLSKISDPGRAVVLVEFQSRPNRTQNIVGTATYEEMFGYRPLPQDNEPANYHGTNQLLLFVDGHIEQCPGNIKDVEWGRKGYSPHIDRKTLQRIN